MKRVRWTFAWTVALFVSSCSECIPDYSFAATEFSVQPECGHTDGEYQVTVLVEGEGEWLGDTHRSGSLSRGGLTRPSPRTR